MLERLRKLSKTFGSLRKPNLDPGVLVAEETFESFWELSGAFGHRGLASYGNSNDPGALVPSETFERCWELSDAFGHRGKARKFSNTFESLGNMWRPSELLVAFGNPNLDPGVLVPAETFGSFWELADASGHRGKASQVFERLWKSWKPLGAFGTVGSLRKPES